MIHVSKTNASDEENHFISVEGGRHKYILT